MHPPTELDDFTEIPLSVRGVDFRVFESDVVTGPAFVLIHGFGVSSRYFGPLAKELSQYGRVLVLDLPGFGKAGGDTPDRDPRIDRFAHVVNATIRRLDVRTPVLVGHSMGTQIAVEALLLDHGLSSGAVLAAPVVNDRERRAVLLMWRFIQSAVKEPPGSAWDSVVGFAHTTPSWLLRNFSPMLRYRIEDRIRETTGPIVVVGGGGDRIAPPQWCRRLARERDGIEVRIIDGSAHEMIHTDAPEVARVAVHLARSAAKGLSTEELDAGQGDSCGGQTSTDGGGTPEGSRPRHSPGLPPCGG